jgi:hypothetical protein
MHFSTVDGSLYAHLMIVFQCFKAYWLPRLAILPFLFPHAHIASLSHFLLTIPWCCRTAIAICQPSDIAHDPPCPGVFHPLPVSLPTLVSTHIPGPESPWSQRLGVWRQEMAVVRQRDAKRPPCGGVHGGVSGRSWAFRGRLAGPGDGDRSHLRTGMTVGHW